MTAPRPPDEAGFTLIETIIALALFGLIAIAGLALVDSVLGIRARTDGRLERLGELQRAMFVVDADLDQISAGPIAEKQGTLSFRRHAASLDGRGEAVRYTLAGDTLQRVVGDDKRPAQRLLTGVSAARWSYYVAGSGWRAGWPPDPKLADQWPAAVALDVSLGKAGDLRRVVDLPARP